MTYWYAAQGVVRTFDASIDEGILWTCPRRPGETTSEDRTNILKMVEGDIVFYHSKSYLRAVSVVTASWRDAPRPSSHRPGRDGEEDDGWLVKVQPLETGLKLFYKNVAQLIKCGSPGPFNAVGAPRQKFLSRLNDVDGNKLLRRLGLEYVDEGLYGRPFTEWLGDNTDGLSISTIRNEQSALRRRLLKGRAVAPCSLCQAELPARLLVAGHIKPRASCSEQERKDYRAAMLICSLGCDVIFEWGYIVVSTDGRMEPGIPAETLPLEAAVAELSGQRCTAHDEVTAPRFESHRQLRIG
ncbi:hypothetical protein [Arthrobacter sp. SX1312]|uniref:hypothetical protein n=1 Tax=Arthrobacter sp. SX1312 TaxID=2058896 RepID=UPI000CE320E4|nr:hypothetical protein [Arthrobacter sp. SX1312]